tara:strand:- start:184 stop:939 length:756 start_codon:yes stop_codon:yes gene_type:complete
MAIIGNNILMGSSGGGYTANAVRFDGTNDYLLRGSDIGGADGKQAHLSFWVKFMGGDGVLTHIYGTSTDRFYVEKQTDNKLRMVSKKTDGSTWMDVQSSVATTVASGWTHVIWEWDAGRVTNPGHCRLYINGVNTAQTGTGGGDATMDWTAADWSIGSTTGGGELLDAEIADFYLILGTLFDIEASTASLRKFYSANGKPVFLGDDGSLPSGGQPHIYLTGDTATWHINAGSGGGFTETGALTDAASSPSD